MWFTISCIVTWYIVKSIGTLIDFVVEINRILISFKYVVSHNRNSVQSWELLHQGLHLIYESLPERVPGVTKMEGESLEGIRTFWGKIMGTSAASPGRNVLKETSWESLDLKGKKPERDRNRDKMWSECRTWTEKDLMLAAWTITYNDYEVIF